MNWFTAAVIAGYIGICEARVPAPYQACESRWNWALGVLVRSPLDAAGAIIARQFKGRRRPDQDATPDSRQQP